jgi:hypothetical protein
MRNYLSLCCIIKNEKYLEEFILYHYIIGVEHFYIYDNNSDYPIKDRLNSFFYKRICTVIDFPGFAKQMDAYNDCIKNLKKKSKWLIVIDGDEYILPKKCDSLKDFLKDYENYQAIGINWVIFGSNYHSKIQDGFSVDKYRRCEGKQDKHVKVIVQPEHVTHFGNPHFATIKDANLFVDATKTVITGLAFNYNPSTNLIQINHYTLRSYEDRMNKYNRGNADSHLRVNLAPSEEQHHNQYNNVIDNELPNRFLNLIKKSHSVTGANAEIFMSLNKNLKFNNPDECYEYIFKNAIIKNLPCHVTDKFPTFNREKYRSLNPHLSHMNDLDLEIHFVNTSSK